MTAKVSGSAPLSLLAVAFLLAFGSSGLIVNAVAVDVASVTPLVFLVNLVGSLVIAMLSTSFFARGLSALLPASDSDALQPAAHVGRLGVTESPVTPEVGQVLLKAMTDAARRNDRFLMEALWSRFLPAYEELMHLVDDGAIGEPQLVEADFGFRVAEIDATHRLFDRAQGGGALLDLGIYPLNLAFQVLGHPTEVRAVGAIGSTGVDEQTAMVMRHGGDTISVCKAAIRASYPCTARIAGTAGSIAIPAFMHCPQHLVVQTTAGERRIEAPMEGNGLHHQVREVQRCIRAGLGESPVMPWSESLALATTMDEIRSQIGLHYDADGLAAG